jgi:hypothetical protein
LNSIPSALLGFSSESETLAFEEIDPTQDLIGRLRLKADEKVFKMVRLRKTNGQPLMLETVFVPVRICPQLTKNDIDKHSLYKTISKYTGHKPLRAIETYEATIIDGATRGQYFRYVALPMLSPVIRTACVLSLIGSLKYFDLIYVMTGGGPGTATELMATYMYKLSFQHFQMGYGSTAAAGMFIMVTSIALIIQNLIKVREDV